MARRFKAKERMNAEVDFAVIFTVRSEDDHPGNTREREARPTIMAIGAYMRHGVRKWFGFQPES